MHKDWILIGNVRLRKEGLTFLKAKKYDKSLTEEKFNELLKKKKENATHVVEGEEEKPEEKDEEALTEIENDEIDNKTEEQKSKSKNKSKKK